MEAKLKANLVGGADQDYFDWQVKVKVLSTINYWAAMGFMCFHPLVMVVFYDFWANYHFLLLAHSL